MSDIEEEQNNSQIVSNSNKISIRNKFLSIKSLIHKKTEKNVGRKKMDQRPDETGHYQA